MEVLEILIEGRSIFLEFFFKQNILVKITTWDVIYKENVVLIVLRAENGHFLQFRWFKPTLNQNF